MDRRAAQIGGWAALAAGVLSLALVFLVATVQLPSRPAPILIIAAVRASFAVTVGLTAYGLWALFTPPTRVVWTGAACGMLAALMLLVTSLLAPLFGPLHVPEWLNMIGYWSPLPLGMWLLITAALAWKLDRLPRSLRVVAAIVGALAFMQPAIPELGLLVLGLGLVWWAGVGSALLRLSSTPFPATTQPADSLP